MALKKSSSNRPAGRKGEDRKSGPKKFFSDQPVRSQGQRTQLKKKAPKKPSW